MEGSRTGRSTGVAHADPRAFFERAGLPINSAVAWQKSGFRVTGNFKRDAAAGTKYWRGGANLLAKLPNKPKRTAEQKIAADSSFRIAAARGKAFFSGTPRRSIASLPKILPSLCAWTISSMTLRNWFQG